MKCQQAAAQGGRCAKSNEQIGALAAARASRGHDRPDGIRAAIMGRAGADA